MPIVHISFIQVIYNIKKVFSRRTGGLCQVKRNLSKILRKALTRRMLIALLLLLDEKAANQDHAIAQCNLGCMYAMGQGVARNYEAAEEWFEKAANQGYAQAQCANTLRISSADWMPSARISMVMGSLRFLSMRT